MISEWISDIALAIDCSGVSAENTCKRGGVRGEVKDRQGTISGGTCKTCLVIIGKLYGHNYRRRRGGGGEKRMGEKEERERRGPVERRINGLLYIPGLTCIFVLVKDVLHTTEGIVL